VIIRNARPICGDAAGDDAPGYEDVDVLNLTSAELHERYGVSLGDFSLLGSIEVVEALAEWGQRPLTPDQLHRLLGEVDLPQPCFLGWQEGRGTTLLPFLTDGSRRGWSLFFEPDGKVATVTYLGSAQQVALRDLPRTKAQPRRGWRPGPALRRGWSAIRAGRETQAPPDAPPATAQAGA